MKIVKLSTQNVLRLSAVEIVPGDADVLVIAGANEAGKSSVLDAIAMALGGEKLAPKKRPIKDGEEKGSITVDLGEYIVERRFTAAGGSLTVKNRDGFKAPSPQALLDGIIGKLSFDPLAFATQDVEKQAATLRVMAGINTDEVDARRAAAYTARTDASREVKRLQVTLDGAPDFPEAGYEPVDVTEMLAVQAQVAEAEVLWRGAMRVADVARNESKNRDIHVEAARQRVARLRTDLAAAEADLSACVTAERAAQAAYVDAERAALTAKQAIPDTTATTAALVAAINKNQQVEKNKQRREIAEQLRTKLVEADTIAKTITRCDHEKAALLERANFPLAGLGLSDAGDVTWNGLPFTQASTAIRTRVSLSIAAALHPRLKVALIRNGNDLDPSNLKALAEFAKEVGVQVWIEKISGGDGLPTVVIEAGAVKETVNV